MPHADFFRGITIGTTLARKVWADHLVRKDSDGAPDLLYIDLMLMYEVTSPQTFESLRLAGRKPRHVGQLIATEDRNTPTVDIDRPNLDETDTLQLTTLEKSCKEFGMRLHPLDDTDQGIVHAFALIPGLTQPDMAIVCDDSHTSTHSAFGTLVFGIGTSEVEHMMTTQTPSLKPLKAMAVNVSGKLPADATAKDIILAAITEIDTGGGQSCVIEYRDEAIRNLTMDERMTVCNMSIEAGARVSMIAPDETTFEYLKGRSRAPEDELWDQAVTYWKTLKTDDDAVFNKVVNIDTTKLGPYVTWGTSPGQGLPIIASVPEPDKIADATKRVTAERAITYMGLKPGMPIRDIAVDTVLIGSYINGRIDDLRQATATMKSHRKAESIHRMFAVPVSSHVRLQAEKEGLDKVFKDLGAEWRNAGCSMYLGMNPDKLVPNERSISTSNRNLEGRQGKGSCTHLASPAVTAATTVRGTVPSPVDL